MCRPGLPLLAPAPTSLRGGSEPARHPTQLLLISTVPSKLWQSCPCRCLQHRAVSRATPSPCPCPCRSATATRTFCGPETSRPQPPWSTATAPGRLSWCSSRVRAGQGVVFRCGVSLPGQLEMWHAAPLADAFSSMQCCLAMLSMSVPSSSLVPIPLACCRRHGLGRGAAEQQWPGAGGAQRPADVPDDWRRHRPGEG